MQLYLMRDDELVDDDERLVYGFCHGEHDDSTGVVARLRALRDSKNYMVSLYETGPSLADMDDRTKALFLLGLACEDQWAAADVFAVFVCEDGSAFGKHY